MDPPDNRINLCQKQKTFKIIWRNHTFSISGRKNKKEKMVVPSAHKQNRHAHNVSVWIGNAYKTCIDICLQRKSEILGSDDSRFHEHVLSFMRLLEFPIAFILCDVMYIILLAQKPLHVYFEHVMRCLSEAASCKSAPSRPDLLDTTTPR